MNKQFKTLTHQDWPALESARRLAHRALQLAAMVPRAVLPADPGDGNANMGWDPELQMFVSNPFGKDSFRSAFKIEDLSIGVLKGKERVASLELDQRTSLEAFSWTQGILEGLGLSTKRLSLEIPYDIPNYPEAQTKLIIGNPGSLAELASYFHNAHLILEAVRGDSQGASAVRCWPHHFDIATLISLDDNPDPELARSIGVGLSPGDESYNLPYYYVTPWPYPEVSAKGLPPFSVGGEWNTEGWVGALLMADKFVGKQNELGQDHIIEQFILEALTVLGKAGEN